MVRIVACRPGPRGDTSTAWRAARALSVLEDLEHRRIPVGLVSMHGVDGDPLRRRLLSQLQNRQQVEQLGAGTGVRRE
jgi:hypothetical protein